MNQFENKYCTTVHLIAERHNLKLDGTPAIYEQKCEPCDSLTCSYIGSRCGCGHSQCVDLKDWDKSHII